MEERNTGDVLWPTYRYYIAAGGWPYFIGVLFFLMATQGLQIGSAFWLSFWGTVNTRAALNGSPLSTDQNVYYLNMYALISMVGVVGLVARALILAQHRLGTSTALHNNLLGATLGAPVAFFDVTPLGRILNRFSSDMQVVDEDLSQNISQLSNSLFQCLGAVGAIACSTMAGCIGAAASSWLHPASASARTAAVTITLMDCAPLIHVDA
jgi:ATP-binding cassette subfamily C (CFTR/MRP) protein 1